MQNLPGKTIERLSQYRQALLEYNKEGKQYIYSHQIAALLHLTPVQVRRDLMLVGYNSTLRKGYHVTDLINHIGLIIDPEQLQKMAIVGMGNIGRAICRYFNNKRPKLSIVAAFDIDPAKMNKLVSCVYCYNIKDLPEILVKENISLAIITVPPDQAALVADKLVKAGIKGILNYSSTRLNVPSNVYIEEYDIITSLEKTAYFARKKM